MFIIFNKLIAIALYMAFIKFSLVKLIIKTVFLFITTPLLILIVYCVNYKNNVKKTFLKNKNVFYFDYNFFFISAKLCAILNPAPK